MTDAPIRVLVVDDHTLFRRGLTALLAGDARFAVVGQAGDAGEAQRQAAALQPDVILLDNHLPGVNGVDALAGLREVAPQARVLMLTVSEDERDLAAALRGGALGYLLKTADSDLLASAIERAMQGASTISPEMTGKLVTAFQTLHTGGDAAAPPARRRPHPQPVAARAGDPEPHRARRQQQGDRARAGHRRDHGQDPRPAHPAQAQRQLARAGRRAACTRELRSSLRRMCCTWILTVVSAMSRARAISLLLAPRAMCARICLSRGERLLIGSASGAGSAGDSAPCSDWKALTSLLVISALTTDSPAMARSIAVASTSLSTVFSR